MKKNCGIFLIFAVMVSAFLACDGFSPFDLSRGIRNPENAMDDTDNNSGTASGADLVALSLTVPTEAWEAETYTEAATVVIKNDSAVAVSIPFKVAVCARNNNPNVYDDRSGWSGYGGTLLGSAAVTDAMAPGEEKTVVMDLVFPNEATVGTDNYIGVWVDYENAIQNELDEDNNKGGYNSATSLYELGDTLKLINIHENKPDIVPVSGTFNPPSSFTYNQSTSITVSIKNIGHMNIANAFKVAIAARTGGDPWVYRSLAVRSSWTTSYGCLLGEVQVVGLSAGETKNLTIPLTIPNGSGVSNGYIGIWVDWQNNISEMTKEWNGDGNYNQGGYNGTTNTYGLGEFLKYFSIN